MFFFLLIFVLELELVLKCCKIIIEIFPFVASIGSLTVCVRANLFVSLFFHLFNSLKLQKN